MRWRVEVLLAFAAFLRLNPTNPMWLEAAAEYERLTNTMDGGELLAAVNQLCSDIDAAVVRYARKVTE